jgi:hypothetical protein
MRERERERERKGRWSLHFQFHEQLTSLNSTLNNLWATILCIGGDSQNDPQNFIAKIHRYIDTCILSPPPTIISYYAYT